MRELVTIRSVKEIKPIPNADAIECATVDGWQVVVKKGEFQPGERGLYFEVDSFLPIQDPRFSFLAKHKIVWQDKEGARLRTMKLRGQLSQGLLLPIHQFPELERSDANDLASLLGIEKYEEPIPREMLGLAKGGFPCFIPKTDQERIQITEQADQLFEATVKLDGYSMTVFYQDGEVGLCSRTWELLDVENNPLWRVAKRSQLPEALKQYGRRIALQGELIGPGIKKNPENLKEQEFYVFDVFDVFDVDTGYRLGRHVRTVVLDELRTLGATIHEVPYLKTLTLSQFEGKIENVLAYAEGPSLNPQTAREGVVFKRIDGQCSFKAISNAYLLKNEG